MVSSSLRRQRGLALLMAMLIVVMATTIAVSIIYEEKFTIRKTGHVQMLERAMVLEVGFEDYARIVLREDRQDSKTDHLEEDWARGVPPPPIDGGYFVGFLEDEQAKFNLNMVVLSELELKRFIRLCDNLGVDDKFIPALKDWIDKDSDITYPDGMEDFHENYRVANREMADISELLLVPHVEVEDYEKLKPHITALPTPTALNVNTMSKEMFQMISPEGDITKFIEERDDNAYDSVEDFITRLQLPIDEKGLSVDTKYFRGFGQVVQGKQVLSMTSLIYRGEGGETLVLNRAMGQF